MSSGIFKRARISIPICLLLVLIVVFSFLMMPAVSSGRPNIITLPATDIGITSATLHGTYPVAGGLFSENNVFADSAPQTGFVWGTSHGGPYPNMTTAQTSGIGSFSATIINLSPFITYYFRAYTNAITMVPDNNAVFADDFSASAFIYGQELNFTTLGQNISASTVASGDDGTTIGTPAEVNFNYINLSPAVASAGQPVTVVANVVNRGTLEGGYTANLQINGYVEQSKMGTVAGNTFVPVKFTIVKDTPGTYNVDIGGQTTTFTVVAGEDTGSSSISQSQIILIAIAVLGIAAIGLLAAVIMRRRSGY